MKFRLSLIMPMALMIFYCSESIAQLPQLRIDKIQHCCIGQLGMIEISFDGDTSKLRYEWSNGSKSKKLENLTEGTYKITLRGELDCEETETEIVIVKLESPQLILTQNIVDNCFIDVRASVIEDTTIANMSGFKLMWSDSVADTETRRFRRTSFLLPICAEVESLGGCVFSDTDCESLLSTSLCTAQQHMPKLLLNEFSKRDDVDGEFMELLVVGDGVCGNHTDIRNYLITSSSGIMDSISSIFSNKFLMKFADHEQWARVPNGSLIVIYEKAKKNQRIPPDDISDADKNNVYILPSNNSLLLSGSYSNSMINDTLLTNTYLQMTPSWNAVDLKAGDRSGIHIRYPEGHLCHGYTVSNIVGEKRDSIPFILINNTEANCACMLDNTDYMLESSYSCDSLIQTPGYANSVDNADLINSLKQCNDVIPIPRIKNEVHDVILSSSDLSSSKLKVYPNPTSDYVYIAIKSKVSYAEVSLLSTLGQVVFRERLSLTDTQTAHLLKFPQLIQPGLYFLKCRYEDGDSETVPIVIVNK